MLSLRMAVQGKLVSIQLEGSKKSLWAEMLVKWSLGG